MKPTEIKIAILLIGIITVSGCGGGSSSEAVRAADSVAPIITIIGDRLVTHEQGTTYEDLGATAADNIDGDVTVATSGDVGVDAGTYNIIYTASDSSGNSSSQSREISVSDTRAPMLNLIGQPEYTLDHSEVYVELGANATDAVDGTIEVAITGEVGATAGTYALIYRATDTAGNFAEQTRLVTVVEPITGDEDNSDETFILADGIVTDLWGGEALLSFFDEKNGYQNCIDPATGNETCGSVDWTVTNDISRGGVLEVTYSDDAGHAGLVVGSPANNPVDLSGYISGNLSFDIKIKSAGSKNLSGGFFVKLESGGANSGELRIPEIRADGDWEEVNFEVAYFVESGAINLSSVTVPIVFFPAFQTGAGLVYQIDNIRFTGISDGSEPPSESSLPDVGVAYELSNFGAGNISNKINPSSYKCVEDYGNWIFNAGLVEPAIDSCNTLTGKPTGTPRVVIPQLVNPALTKSVPTHRWWGSIPFVGEMKIDDASDAAYITPDPIRARISNRGVRVSGIPGGFKTIGNFPRYEGPVPFMEVFEGVAIANAAHSNLDAYLKNSSDASVTVQWKTGDLEVMEATFVHGSPHIYFTVLDGHAILKTKASDGGEKGIFYRKNNSLGVWTDVAGVRNSFLINGEAETVFSDIATNEITISGDSNEFTLTYLPKTSGIPDDTMCDFFSDNARDAVDSVEVDFTVDRTTNNVTISHAYYDREGAAITTIVGLHPLHWRHSSQTTSDYKVRSARGIIKFAKTDSFSYTIPSVGVLPTLPNLSGAYDVQTLKSLVSEFVGLGAPSWVNSTDTYWAGKAYGKAAELAAIADTLGMATEARQLIDWLKLELSDWFSAETAGSLNINKYFVYDDTWDALLGVDEAYGSHQRLADHHFHYGYFVRAAAEICRVDPSWCSQAHYGPMIELLIRDYAGGKDDPMFPHLRNFDPANGFSWADGKADALQGNNNESTSEAANAYGAIILYGLATGNNTLIEKGMYLHASTSAAYWQYWNDIDGYKNPESDDKNFPPGYDKITTSIVWGSGADFSTWFSSAYAHILGIQGLPSNTLIFHVSLYPDYMRDYVALGLTESSNGKPSGLPDDHWRDLWWNLWAMSDATAAVADYNTLGSNYVAEAGESKAHTYHWINTMMSLGQIKTGTGELTSNHPASVAFEKDGHLTYVTYNFSSQAQSIVFSNGRSFTATPRGFTVISD